jgi:hypothetical protein
MEIDDLGASAAYRDPLYRKILVCLRSYAEGHESGIPLAIELFS